MGGVGRMIRTATHAVSKRGALGSRTVHASTMSRFPLEAVLACDGRTMRYETIHDTRGEYKGVTCSRCLAGMATGRIVWREVAE